MATITAPAGDAPPSPTPPSGPRKPHRWHAPVGIGLAILATIIGLIVLAWAILFVTKGRFLKHRFESIVSSLAQRQVRVAGDFQLYLDPINVKFVADGMTVSNPGWASKPNFFEARHIDTRISTIRAIFGHYHARWLHLDGAQIDTEWDAARTHNTWTFGDPNKTGKPFQMPVIERAAVTGTTLRYRDPKMGISTDQRFGNIDSTGRHIDDAISFEGEGSYQGKGFVNSGALLSPNTTVTLGRTQVRLHAAMGPTTLDLTGTMPTLSTIEGSEADLQVRGPNARLLGDLAHIVIPDTRAYRLHSHLLMQDDEYRFTRLAGVFGDSDIAGSLTFSLPKNRPTLKATLASRKLDIIDIGPFIGYEPQTLATKGATAAATTVSKTDHPRILPDAPLRLDAMKMFDAHVDYKVRTIRAPHIPVSDVALTLDLDHNRLRLSPLTMNIVDTGRLAADIGLDARTPAVFTTYDIRLSPTPLGKLMAGFGMKDAGTTGTVKARVQMSGTGDSVRKSLATANGRIAIGLPAGTFWTSYAQLSEFDIGVFLQKLLQDKLKKPIHINCGLIGFTVKDGIAAADPILIDTDKNLMAAKGGFSFKDESMNIQFRADAKKFSAFSGQSPVGIGGYFAAPALQIITPQLLARGGAAVALGVLTPPAVVLAFIDPGDAKSAACGPVLAGATAAQQHSTKGKPLKLLGTKGANKTEAAEPKKKKFLGIF